MALLDPNTILPLFVAFVLGITVHEFAHAYVAYQMGDMLPVYQGRVTLDPRAHLTFWGVVLIFLIGFGWGKPVMHTITNPRQRLWVSLAGPISNVILAFIFGIFFRLQLVEFLNVGPVWFNLQTTLYYIVSINVLLAVFNMIPLSPLDGSSVFAGILPEPYSSRLAMYNAQYPNALIVFLLANYFLVRAIDVDILHLILQHPIKLLLFLSSGL